MDSRDWSTVRSGPLGRFRSEHEVNKHVLDALHPIRWGKCTFLLNSADFGIL